MNTWLLIARRVMPSRLLDILFYATWIVIRNIFFPYLIWDVCKDYYSFVQESGTVFHPILFAPIMQVRRNPPPNTVQIHLALNCILSHACGSRQSFITLMFPQQVRHLTCQPQGWVQSHCAPYTITSCIQCCTVALDFRLRAS